MRKNQSSFSSISEVGEKASVELVDITVGMFLQHSLSFNIVGRVLIEKIHATILKFLKIPKIFQRVEKGGRKEKTSWSMLVVKDPLDWASMEFRPPFSALFLVPYLYISLYELEKLENYLSNLEFKTSFNT